MLSISQCEYDINRYRSLKSAIYSVISKLSLASNDTNNLSNDIKSRYQVNDSYTPIVGRIIDLNGDIVSTCNYLSNKVIPAIDNAINNLYSEISRLEAEEREREERERQEQEKKKNTQT